MCLIGTIIIDNIVQTITIPKMVKIKKNKATQKQATTLSSNRRLSKHLILHAFLDGPCSVFILVFFIERHTGRHPSCIQTFRRCFFQAL